MSNLDSFVSSARPNPLPLFTSQEIRDRGSIFSGTLYRASTPAAARAAIAHIAHVVHASRRASHEIAAWRCMVLRDGRTGLAGPEDFELRTGSEDDGERWGGTRVLRVMQAQGIIDAAIIVSRWYGGTLLGPARFDHIETCATEVCRAFKRGEELEEALTTLTTLDDLLSDLRAELVQGNPAHVSTRSSVLADEGNSATPVSDDSKVPVRKPKPDYSSLHDSADLTKIRRLISAREKAVDNVKNLLAKRKKAEETDRMDG